MKLTKFQDKSKLIAAIHQINISPHFNTTLQFSERRSKAAVQRRVPCMRLVTFNMFVPQHNFKDLER